ncbi:uncharacterized protein LOC113772854 isoform X1 [Coffea eugenioides]|uniref:uncharacterized protein LOC113772854 isoform X1 n=1 Tax=Coffea eugenioides TaxID=49369 RepID=UPI000F609851|nr:uncharacterized protein LOC113772854 isoform X1 [Coffea eugenioides]
MPGETSVIYFSTLSSICLPKDTTILASSSSLSALSKFPSFSSKQLPLRSFRFVPKASGSGHFLGDEAFGHYPWESSSDSGDSSIQWVPEERVTLFTADGLIQIGGNLVPRRITSGDKKYEKIKTLQRIQRFQESDYMDPSQGLCLGALFDIAATNGLDTGRRLCIFGFCRSVEMLSDVVEDTVLEHGGEVVAAEKASKGGLHEKLTMTVAVPLLWGVPPASETLHLAVRSGGGIVEKVYWQWDFV